jgi:hypothetical protein
MQDYKSLNTRLVLTVLLFLSKDTLADRLFLTAPIQAFSLTSPSKPCGTASQANVHVIVKNLSQRDQTVTVSMENESLHQQIAVLNSAGLAGWTQITGDATNGSWEETKTVSRTANALTHKISAFESCFFDFSVASSWLKSGMSSPVSHASVNARSTSKVFLSLPASNLNTTDASKPNYSSGQALNYSTVVRFGIAENIGAVSASVQAVVLQLSCGADAQTTAAQLTPVNGGRPF